MEALVEVLVVTQVLEQEVVAQEHLGKVTMVRLTNLLVKVVVVVVLILLALE
jgi:hypothetical protein